MSEINVVIQPLVSRIPIEISMTKPAASVTTANVKAALDITTLSGSNTGDQDLSGKQATLVSGSNIKTINSAPILGAGDLVVVGDKGDTGLSAYQQAVSGGYASTENQFQTDLAAIQGLEAAILAIGGGA